MVFHAEAGWGGLPTHVQKKNLYLETDEFASTPPFSKKSVQLEVTFGGTSQPGVTFGGNIFKKTFGGKLSNTIWREIFKYYLVGTFWREHFGGKFEIFFTLRKLFKMLLF